MEVTTPAELYLIGNAHQAAAALLSDISFNIRKAFDKDLMKAKVKLTKLPEGPTQLYIIMKLERAGWTDVGFFTEDGAAYIEMVADISPEEKDLYLS